MEIITFKEGEPIAQETGLTIKKLFANSGVDIRQSLIKTGGKIDKYTSDKEVLYFIVEGEGTMVIKAERKRVTAGMLIKCPPKALRAVINNSGKDLNLLIVTLN